MTTTTISSSERSTVDVLRLAQPALRLFLPALALGILASGSAVALLATAAWLITKAAEQPPILFLGFAIVGVRAFALGRAFFRYLERLVSHNAAFVGLSRLRVGILDRLIPRAPDGLGATGRGDLLTRLVSDVDQLQDLPLRVVQPLATSIVVAIASVWGIWLVLPEAALVLVITLVLAAVGGTVLHGILAGGAERAIAPLRAGLADAVLDYTLRLDVLIAFDAIDAAKSRIRAADARLRTARLRVSLGAGVISALMVLLIGAAMLGGVLIGAPAVSAGLLEGPTFALVVLVPLAIFEVFAMVPLAAGAWRQVRTSAARVADVVVGELPAELPVSPAVPLSLPEGELVLELAGVAARWPGVLAPAISNVSFILRPGDCLLLTGESGSGKTTIAHVLARFLNHTGSYTLTGADGRSVDVRDLNPDEVRRVVGLCEQSPHLFDESIRHNLSFANDNASDEQLLAALDSVGLAAWVAERGGLDAPVGERGSLVSGGQAQRIALARALLADFPILILDEPTAHVDNSQADALMADLLTSAAAAKRAVLLISHTPVDSRFITGRVQLT